MAARSAEEKSTTKSLHYYSEKRRQPHLCLVAFNKFINVRSESARRERQNIRFLCAKAKDIHKVVRISQLKLMLYVIRILDRRMAFLCGCCRLNVVVKHDRTTTLLYIALAQ